jgi:hypothetical protein
MVSDLSVYLMSYPSLNLVSYVCGSDYIHKLVSVVAAGYIYGVISLVLYLVVFLLNYIFVCASYVIFVFVSDVISVCLYDVIVQRSKLNALQLGKYVS